MDVEKLAHASFSILQATIVGGSAYNRDLPSQARSSGNSDATCLAIGTSWGNHPTH
jgi:hypothetical protein